MGPNDLHCGLQAAAACPWTQRRSTAAAPGLLPWPAKFVHATSFVFIPRSRCLLPTIIHAARRGGGGRRQQGTNVVVVVPLLLPPVPPPPGDGGACLAQLLPPRRPSSSSIVPSCSRLPPRPPRARPSCPPPLVLIPLLGLERLVDAPRGDGDGRRGGDGGAQAPVHAVDLRAGRRRPCCVLDGGGQRGE